MTTLIDEQELVRVAAPLAEAWTLPPAAYTSGTIFQKEVTQIFHQDWSCVGRVEQVANVGDFVSVDLFGQPIVVVRVAADEIKVLSRVCLHRAMPIVEGEGNATRFVCPYHKWTYELDGRLRSAPMMQGVAGFETDNCSLPELKVELWLGFIFVNLSLEAERLSPKLAELSDDLAIHNFAGKEIVETIEFDSPWNWKLLVENFMEAYHHIGPHAETFEPLYPARASFVEGGEQWSLLRMPAKDSGPDHPEQPDMSELLAGVVFPMFLFAASAHSGIWYQLEPSSESAMRLRIHILQEPEVYAAMSEEERVMHRELVRAIHLEDIDVNQGPWRGMQAPLTRQGRLSLFEEAIWQLNQYWLGKMEDALKQDTQGVESIKSV